MATYHVYHASLIRKSGLLGATIVSEEPSDRPGGWGLVVDGEPSLKLDVRTMRHVWTEDNKISDRRIIVIEPPAFPISELVGKRLVPFIPDNF